MDAATFEAMFRPFEELLFRHGRATGARDTFENRSYDAFLAMLAHHTHLATQPANSAEASPDPAPETGPAPTPPAKAAPAGGPAQGPPPARAGRTDDNGCADHAPEGGDASGSSDHGRTEPQTPARLHQGPPPRYRGRTAGGRHTSTRFP